ncbi:hypothetical protein D3C86_898620 [compost metagenome]
MTGVENHNELSDGGLSDGVQDPGQGHSAVETFRPQSQDQLEVGFAFADAVSEEIEKKLRFGGEADSVFELADDFGSFWVMERLRERIGIAQGPKPVCIIREQLRPAAGDSPDLW